ncbi:MAG: prepilin-type N-terminal cleavage/methylation domain-containing protein [Pseudomonadota bacterium]
MLALKNDRGFTLIEMLVVLAIIAILSVMALPSAEPTVARKQVLESLDLIEDYKKGVVVYFKASLNFPQDNLEAGIPKPEFLIGNFVNKIELQQGAFHIYFGSKAHPAIKDKILTVRPVVVKGSPESPMSWICGYSAVPEGMLAASANKTTVEFKYLPLSCRI